MRVLCYVLAPLLVLFVAIALSCCIGFVMVHYLGVDIALRKIIIKTTQLLLLLSIFPLMRILHLNKQALGFAPRQYFFKQIIQGFGLGFITLIPVFILLTVLKVNMVDLTQPWTLAWIAKKMGVELLLALLIGFFEESVFRGLLLTGLNKVLGLLPAILLSAFYYALLHFLNTKTLIPLAELHWYSGFILFKEAFANLWQVQILPAFWALLMVGLYLGCLRSYFKASLGLCIGCHASWVWQIKLNKDFFNTDFTSPYAGWVSSYDGVIGPLVSLWLLLVISLFLLFKKRPLSVQNDASIG